MVKVVTDCAFRDAFCFLVLRVLKTPSELDKFHAACFGKDIKLKRYHFVLSMSLEDAQIKLLTLGGQSEVLLVKVMQLDEMTSAYYPRR